MKKSTLIATLACIFLFLLGCFLRLEGIFTKSFAFTYDVGRDLLNLSQFVHTHKLLLIGPTTGLPGVFYGPWWYYILLPTFLLFSGDPQGVALFMALVGIAVVCGGYVFGKKVAGNTLAIILGVLLSISPALIGFSSQIWNPNIAPIFVLGTFVCLYIILTKENKHIAFFFLGILLSLLVDTEIVFGLLFLLGTLVSMAILFRKKITLLASFASIVGFTLILLPRIFFDLRHQFLMTKSLLHLLTFNTGSGSFQIVQQIQKSAWILFAMWNYSFANQLHVSSILFGFTILGTLFYWKSFSSSVRIFIIHCYILIGVFFVGLSFFKHDIFSHYIVGIPFVYIFLVSLVGQQFVQKNFTKYLFFGILILTTWFAIRPVQLIASFSEPLWVGDASVYRNQVQVVDYVYKSAQGKEFKTNVYSPPIFAYSYDYLLQWYGQKAYHYQPVKKSTLAFFILEPDLQNPQRLQDWLALRQKDGTILQEKKFPSGIIVQIRK